MDSKKGCVCMCVCFIACPGSIIYRIKVIFLKTRLRGKEAVPAGRVGGMFT